MIVHSIDNGEGTSRKYQENSYSAARLHTMVKEGKIPQRKEERMTFGDT